MTEEVKQQALTRNSKGRSKPTFTRLLDSSHIAPAMTMRGMATVFKMDPTIGVSMPNLKILKQNPPTGSASPRANRARDKAT
jgi:hypothetical protein